MNSLHILIISKELPMFPGKGSAVRLWYLSRLLSAEFDISLLVLDDEPDFSVDLPWFEKIVYFPFNHQTDSFIGATLGELSSLDAVQNLRYKLITRPKDALILTPPYLRRMEETIVNIDRDSPSDLYGFLISTDALAGVIRAVPTHGIALLDCHKISSIALQAEADSCTSRKNCKELLREAKRFKSYESRFWGKYDIISLTSAEDLEAATRKKIVEPDRLALVPNGVDVNYFDYYDGKRDRNMLLFVGDFSTPSNVEAAVSIIEDVLPEIRRYNSEYQMIISGRNVPDHLKSMAKRNSVEIKENVEDIRTLYKKAFAFISPYHSGGGARLTVLEAFASGLPVITSTFGLHGLDVRHEMEIMVADSNVDFALSLKKLDSSEILYNRIQRRARKYVEKIHQWDKVANRMSEVFLRQHTISARRIRV